MTDLSVIIPSYNTSEITSRCLDALIKNLSKYKVSYEIIVIDNASTDGSKQMLGEYQVTAIFNKQNLGYSKANNQGIKISKGRYILLLNSDAIVEDVDFNQLFTYFEQNPEVAVLTVKVTLQDGGIDPASHRGFPTVWNSFCYFTGLEKLFGKVPGLNRIFGGYHLTHLNLNRVHEIDSPTGAFYMTRADVLKQVNGLDDKNFFFYGEDLDLSYRIKEQGYKIIYYPQYSVLHLKYVSGLKADEATRKKTKEHFYEAMRIFYRKHYEQKNPKIVNWLVYAVIDLKKRMS